jgi:sialate O-acetylesterase
MVLQQDVKLPVWGWADSGERVTVSAAGQKVAATAGQDGKWMVKLDAIKNTDQPIELVVSGKNTLTLKDVLIGEVWVCSGQSNMEYGLLGAHNAATEVPQANHSRLRLFKVAHKVAYEPQSDCEGTWEICTPQSANAFSAVAYFFGRDLHQTLGRPVGLIGSHWGATSAQVWTSLDTLRSRPDFKEFVNSFESFRASVGQLDEEYAKEILPAWEAEHKKWQEECYAPYQLASKQWIREVEKAKAEGKPLPSKPVLKSPRPKPTCRTQIPNNTSVLYMGMIAPLIPYAIKGVIWYQGESNQGNPALYRTLFPTLITDWRNHWGQGDFPFLFVQLPNYSTPSDWPGLRESQLSALALPNTGTAITIDIGEADNGHPRNKIDVGRRLALTARHIAYGEDLVYCGPIYKSMEIQGDTVRLAFDHVGSGLTIGTAPSIHQSLPPALPKSILKGFIIAGADKQFVTAQAKIEGDSVVVWSEQVSQPVTVRYGWASNPEVNLYNKEQLPAAPFRTDSNP